MTLGEIIRLRREGSGSSLRALARQVGVNPAYLSRVEQGVVPPSEQLLGKLARALGMSQDELFLLAGRLPASLRHFIELAPDEVTKALTGLAAMVVSEPTVPFGGPVLSSRGQRAIEDGFPFAELSDIAEIESWRKEVYRPVYHLHKWWAQRLGSVFRALILGATMPRGSAIIDLFYQPVRLPAPVVFDPFMGSGTTVGEAHKLGCTVIGRDINPVAYRSVRVALSPLSREKLNHIFEQLQKKVEKKLQALYRSTDSAGDPCDVLYYFWVKTLSCPECASRVDLFSSYIFARHAYGKSNPRVRVLCPACGDIFPALSSEKRVTCRNCSLPFDPQDGPVARAKATCPECGSGFPIAKTVRRTGKPPEHRLYAKLVLRQDGTKEYLRATEADFRAYQNASQRLRDLDPPKPKVPIRDGYNTRQVLNYGYSTWDQMFNDRQHLVLAILARGIRELPAGAERDALMLLFSGVLEFNNMFASYKGEGTGAVRHMFSHHVLKPERTPIEANVWGTPKSSGSYLTLFRSRLLRALDYKQAPFEVAVAEQAGRTRGKKVFGISPPMAARIFDRHPEGWLPAASIYLSCGDSSKTDLPDRSVDLVATDPPFFDNVHYSELADFFHVWQTLYFDESKPLRGSTTRHPDEVQDTDSQAFATKLQSVFRECHRVLKEDGLLVFSYHHSRDDGWDAVARAVWGAGFTFVQAQPVKAEMSVATPKARTKSPIDLDVLLVCRKRSEATMKDLEDLEIVQRALRSAAGRVETFNLRGRLLSENDVRVVAHSHLLVELSQTREPESALEVLQDLLAAMSAPAIRLWRGQKIRRESSEDPEAQLELAL